MDKRQHERDQTETFSLQGEPVAPFTLDLATSQEPAPEWLQSAKAGLAPDGKFLAFEDSGTHKVVQISREWTRIGRSLSADVRFDDTTVSRRHALIVSQANGVRILDDRSLNGVYVNGKRVEWSELHEGDVITIGRHQLYFVESTTIATTSSPEVVGSPE
jgi:pSer/pThr/pTyr-binding forkhead associated (FHA) protein